METTPLQSPLSFLILIRARAPRRQTFREHSHRALFCRTRKVRLCREMRAQVLHQAQYWAPYGLEKPTKEHSTHCHLTCEISHIGCTFIRHNCRKILWRSFGQTVPRKENPRASSGNATLSFLPLTRAHTVIRRFSASHLSAIKHTPHHYHHREWKYASQIAHSSEIAVPRVIIRSAGLVKRWRDQHHQETARPKSPWEYNAHINGKLL